MTIVEAREIVSNPHLHPNTEAVIFVGRWMDAIIYELENQRNCWYRAQISKWALKPLRRCIMRVLITEARLHVYEAGPTPQLRLSNEKIPIFLTDDTQHETESKQLQLFAGQGIVKR